MSYDPLCTCWDALEAKGCGPRGPLHKAIARCPAHEDRLPSLSLAEGADGRALLHCFAGCDTGAEILPALGLAWSDLFPDGHRHAGPRRTVRSPVEKANPVVALLAGLSTAGIPWHRTANPRLFTVDRCPGCDERRPGALWIHYENDRAKLACFNGCSFETILASPEHELRAYERIGKAAA